MQLWQIVEIVFDPWPVIGIFGKVLEVDCSIGISNLAQIREIPEDALLMMHFRNLTHIRLTSLWRGRM